MIFEKLEVTTDSSNVDDCHWLPGNQNNRFIIKLSKCKDANKIRMVKKNLKGMNLSSIGITTPMYINDSLCSYYKMLRRKCKKLWSSKFVHTFWVSNGSIKLKIADNDRVYTITHNNDLEELFCGTNFYWNQSEMII